jgi:iron complex outermembrane receptor protein
MLLLALFLGQQMALFAQYSLSGTVTDESGSILVNANVQVDNSSPVETNSSGEFIISNLAKGDYNLRISHTDYAPYEQKITLTDHIKLTVKLTRSVFLSDEVIVHATRGSENAPLTQSRISKEELKARNLGQDMPYLMEMTPSMVSSSDAGAGVGYTNFRIRGTDHNRINITMNGIPVNDAESHGVWWVDLPDIASSVDNIQIQRGVGSSSLGAGAFGASINLQTNGLQKSAYAEIANSVGSFNTLKNSVSFGTGLIKQHFTFDGRFSRIVSDGFIDRASSNLKSYYLSGAYYTEKTLLKVNVFSGTEKTYQAWDGVPDNLISSNRTYNGLGEYMTFPDSSIHYYNNQTDNYWQDHYQALFSHSFSDKLTLNAAMHYTYGRGYYEEYKTNQDITAYKLDAVIVGSDTLTTSNLVRRKWIDNDFYGATWSLNYRDDNLDASFGGGINEYDGRHYGRVIWAQYMSNGQPDHQYYYSDGTKTDFNIYAKANYNISQIFSVYGDFQYRHIRHSLNGEGDDNDHADITQQHTFDFANPKAGFNIKLNENNKVYGFAGMSHREPSRDNFVDADPLQPSPKAETLLDYELGYQFQTQSAALGVNLYYMDYTDQLILTGKINDVGAAIMTNVDKSYREGVELTAAISLFDRLKWEANATFSRSIIKNFVSYTDDWDTWGQEAEQLGQRQIAFSPQAIAASQLTFSLTKQVDIGWTAKYVGKQYIDNTQSNSRALDAYLINNLLVKAHFGTKLLKKIDLIAQVNNLFNEKYSSNAWAYTYFMTDSETNVRSRNQMIGYYPQAGINYMAGLILSF